MCEESHITSFSPSSTGRASIVLLVALSATLVACGDNSDPAQPPEVIRKCGGLEGVDPVEPVVVGQYPIELARGEMGSCPMLAPVPCTRPIEDYLTVCGERCLPTTAVNPDGDTWLVGCAVNTRGMPCGGPDFHRVECGRDPYNSNAYWFEFRECQHPFVPFWFCWPPCDGDPYNEPEEWCP